MNYKIALYYPISKMETVHYEGSDAQQAAEWWNFDVEKLKEFMGLGAITELRAYEDGIHVSTYDPMTMQIKPEGKENEIRHN